MLSFSARGANNVSAKETQTVKIDGTLSAVPSLKRSSWELKIDGAVCATSVSVTWTQCQMTRTQKPSKEKQIYLVRDMNGTRIWHPNGQAMRIAAHTRKAARHQAKQLTAMRDVIVELAH